MTIFIFLWFENLHNCENKNKYKYIQSFFYKNKYYISKKLKIMLQTFPYWFWFDNNFFNVKIGS
jgi:hypothetical protein